MNIFKINKNLSPKTSENILAFFAKTQGREFIADISKLNLLDATKTAIKYSVELYTKFPDKKISWIVKDIETKKMISNLALSNMSVKIKTCTSLDKVCSIR